MNYRLLSLASLITDYIGAVDPLRGDDIAPWWSEWSIQNSSGGDWVGENSHRWIHAGIVNQDSIDRDGDGIADPYDAFPDDRSERYDTDLDGIGNNRDTDDDNDGVADGDDAFPLDVNETVDSDGDGVGDNSDVFPDDDSEWADSDGDGIGDNADIDADGNGYADCPVGTTEVEGNVCLVPSKVQTDLTLTYHASVDIQQPDYLMDSRVEVGELGYIGSAEDLLRVLDNSATLTLGAWRARESHTGGPFVYRAWIDDPC